MEWQPISTAPRDGTTIIACRASRYPSERWFGSVWFQPEFDTFIESCHEMQMHNGYRFGDGTTRQLHSPAIPNATHWLCEMPTLPRDSDRSGEAGETGTGSTEGESAGPKDIAHPFAPGSKDSDHAL